MRFFALLGLLINSNLRNNTEIKIIKPNFGFFKTIVKFAIELRGS